MEIINSDASDIDTIFKLYDEGTTYQKKVAKKHWKGFERSLIEVEIEEKRQFKIIVDGQVACVFAVTFNDPLIWKEKDKDPAIYIHRISTNPLFRGNSFVKHIIEWAKQYAKENGKHFIRMDTGSGNDKLNNYYISCGFTYLGITSLDETDDLPMHYKGGSSSLFEITLETNEDDITSLKYLPANLPVPEDDGACDHLLGMKIPDISLSSTNGASISLKDIKGRLVIYCYPMTGAPEVKLPDGWDAIPGARGCTPQACSFRDHFKELQQLQTSVFGMSTQTQAIQQSEKERIHLPFDLLSDENLSFASALKLPFHFVDGMYLIKRLTLIFEDGYITKCFYPVFPPDKNIDEVLLYLNKKAI